MAEKYLDKKAEKIVTPAATEASYDEVKSQYKFYFNVVKKRYMFFAISFVIILAGVISLFVQGLNLGIDFKGGSMFDIRFNQPVTQAKVTEALDSLDLSGSVQLSPDGTEVLIRTDVLEEEKSDALLTSIEKNVGSFDRKNMKVDKVGPTIGAELSSGAFKASIVASILILIYISFRFRFAFALGGIIALIHDVLVTVGLFSIFQWEVDATFVAAILTILGYSINDTVVIFDRIRENESRLKKKDNYEDMVDKSIWQTMGRSLKTACTVILSLLAIFVLGGESTRVFSLAMLLGTFSGVYSTVFIASQFVVEVKNRFGGNKNKKPAEA